MYTFEWFDEGMDAFQEAGIEVFLDISMRPALMGFGLCKEQGDDPVSYSEAAQERFQK